MFEYRMPAGRGLPIWFISARDRPVEVVLQALAPRFRGDVGGRRRAVLTMWAALQGVVSMVIAGTLLALNDNAEPRRIVRLLVARYVTGNSPQD